VSVEAHPMSVEAHIRNIFDSELSRCKLAVSQIPLKAVKDDVLAVLGDYVCIKRKDLERIRAIECYTAREKDLITSLLTGVVEEATHPP